MEGREMAATPSAEITGDAVVTGAPALYWGATLAVGTTASQLLVYDNATGASGTIIDRLMNIAAVAAGDTMVTHIFAKPINCVNGIYVDWGGTGAIGKVWYEPK